MQQVVVPDIYMYILRIHKHIYVYYTHTHIYVYYIHMYSIYNVIYDSYVILRHL